MKIHRKGYMFFVVTFLILIGAGLLYAASDPTQPIDNNGRTIANALTPSTHHAVAINAASSSSTGIISHRIVRVTCTTNAYVKMGLSTATATTDNSMYMGSGVIEYFDMKDNTVIAGITSLGSGTLHVTEMR